VAGDELAHMVVGGADELERRVVAVRARSGASRIWVKMEAAPGGWLARESLTHGTYMLEGPTC
jgi:hypothetical protein